MPDIILIEITELQKNEILTTLNYQTLFESLPGLYLILTKDFYIVTASNAYLEATLTKREEIFGRHLFEVFPDSNSSTTGTRNLRASLLRVLAKRSGDVMPLQKYDIPLPDGGFEERYWSPFNAPLLDEKGEVIYIIHRVEDVTKFVQVSQQNTEQVKENEETHVHVKKMETEVFQRSLEVAKVNEKVLAEREHLIQKLTKSNQELERFAYAAAHDLKSPLHSISNLSQWIEEDLGDALGNSKEHMTKLRQQVQRMKKLLDDLLEYSRVEQKLTPDETKIVDGDTLIKNIISLISPSNAFIIMTSEAFKSIQVPRMPLQQIFFNLIQNAVKHHGKAGGLIDISVEENDSEYTFKVCDDGQGIAPEYHQKIFEMFQTLAPRHKDGTGMGLAFVKKLVTANGGDIKVESSVGQGTCFVFTWLKTIEQKGARNV